jgi:hypothetical protein
MQFIPGQLSVLDTNAGGKASYAETLPAVYGNYLYDKQKFSAEIGLRLEYMNLNYTVNPNHPTYKSGGYSYFQPFPSMRFSYKLSDKSRFSLFLNRRVDRPNEVDIRIFPKYDDAEIIKVGNPNLRPQFTNSIELGYKHAWQKGSIYAAAYHRISDGTITRISTVAENSNLIYAVFQNAGRSYNTGLELAISQKWSSWYNVNLSVNAYHNQINAFSVTNLYPTPSLYSASKQEIYAGNIKFNQQFTFIKNWSAQMSATYFSPDIIPQGTIAARFSLDFGIKKTLQNKKGEFFLNASDILNTMVIRRTINGSGFRYTSTDYYETQVVRVGYSRSF